MDRALEGITNRMDAEPGLELRKFVVPEFVYGLGALEQIGRYARNFGATKALVVTDPGIVRAGWTGSALASLAAEGIGTEVFQEVTPNPKAREVGAGVRRYRDAKCDIIVAVGGGSPMDCAKGIGIAHANDADVLRFEGVDEVALPGPPLICVPTTAGSSADVSQFAIISDEARAVKVAIISKMVVPDVALIDPETTTTMPAELTAATGLDALVHAIEAYVSNASSPTTDLHALAAIPLLSRNLVNAIGDPGNLSLRHPMMYGSLLAGMAFSNASLGLVHAMSHSLGGLLGLPHGMCNALLLDRVVEFNYAAASERYERVAQAMGLDVLDAPAAQRKSLLLAAIADLRRRAGIDGTVGTLGVKPADIPQLASNTAHDPCLATNPRRASLLEIEGIFRNAL